MCPSTLVGHWPHEIAKFVGFDVLRPLAIEGSPHMRTALQEQLPQHDIAVVSFHDPVIALLVGVECSILYRT